MKKNIFYYLTLLRQSSLRSQGLYYGGVGKALWLATGMNGVLGFAGFRKDAPRLAAGCFTFLIIVSPLLAESQVQTIVLTSPLSNLTFSAGDEFATTFVGNPWNMKQIRDIPFDLNFQEPSVANNEWTGTFLNQGAAFYPLWRGFSSTTVTDYPYYYDGGMPLSAHNPIDTAKYSRMATRVSMDKADRSSLWIVWTTNLNQFEYAPNGSMGFIDADYLSDGHSEKYADGYRIYDFGFTAAEFFNDRVREPSPGFNLFGSWSGNVYGFLVHPTLDGPAGTTVKVNWIRLYDPVASPKLQFAWNTPEVSMTNDYQYSIQLWVDSNNAGYDGDLLATCLKDDGLFELNTAALPPGDYYFYLKLVERGSSAWTELARSGYSARVAITHPPSVEFTAPTHTSGDDYATVELGNPWDMSDSSDIYDPLHLSGISFANGIMIASADPPVPPATESDSQFYLNTKLNGQWNPIDANRYRYFTFRIMVDRTGYTNINDWVARGWYPRVVWCTDDISVDGSEGQGIPLFENWHSYTVDLADRSLLTTGNPYPAQLGWRELGLVKRLRFDPLEVFQATTFGIDDIKLCADNTSVNNRYTISWTTSDPDSASLNINLFYGTLSGNNFSGAQIAAVTSAPGPASYVWDTSAVRAGSYYIQAVVSDGTNTFSRTSLVPVIVAGSGASYFSLTNASAFAADFDGDGLADPALYQESTGNWQAKLSGSDYFLVNLPGFLGGAGYSALAADFDGDGKADPAVYKAETGSWLIKLSGNGYLTLSIPGFLGGTGYSALAADFDGDGLADPAVYKAATGDWLIKYSGSGYVSTIFSMYWGSMYYSALAADFDGDGKADPTAHRINDKEWLIRLSGNGYLPFNSPYFLGEAGYTALAADFDGDGLADYAVYQSATGIWQIKFSSGGYVTTVLTL